MVCFLIFSRRIVRIIRLGLLCSRTHERHTTGFGLVQLIDADTSRSVDLSAAFDNVDHDTLLRRMRTSYYGLDSAVLNWFNW